MSQAAVLHETNGKGYPEMGEECFILYYQNEQGLVPLQCFRKCLNMALKLSLGLAIRRKPCTWTTNVASYTFLYNIFVQ